MKDALAIFLKIVVPLFAITSMLSIGLKFSTREVLGPLRNIRGVVLALVANFVLVPLWALLIVRMIPLDRPYEIGLILIAFGAGAPFLLKLTKVAQGDLALASSLLVLLVVTTLFYMPWAITIAIPEATVDIRAIIQSLSLTLLLPLGIGHLVEARAPTVARKILPVTSKISTFSLVALIVTTCVANFEHITNIVGERAILASLLLIGGGALMGFLLGTSNHKQRVIGLGTGQRNIAAATIVAQDFQDPQVLVMVIVSSIVGIFFLFPLARFFRRLSMKQQQKKTQSRKQPNILVLCMDQWEARMKLPKEVKLPAMHRLEAQGVTLDRHYCTVPICTPSRGTMWTGIHAKNIGLWDNTNFAWIDGMPDDTRSIGHMLRENGYYTAFKGKWHLTDLPMSEDALEKYGFSDYQGWGDNFGPPLGGAQMDCSVSYETIDWLEHKSTTLNQPWMLVCSLVNPHDIMFLETDPIEVPHPNGAIAGMKTPVQRLSIFQDDWNVGLPENFQDDFKFQPDAVKHYKEFIDANYGRIPDDRVDLWLKRRNYFINALRMVDEEFKTIIDTLDRLDLWENTVVILTGDHGDMNGAHRLTQKGGIPFDEASIVPFTICGPGIPQGKRSDSVGSHLDLAPTLLEFAGLSEEEIRVRYPRLKGRSLKRALIDPTLIGPRGTSKSPGDGALLCWDGLHQLDNRWAISGALQKLTNMTTSPNAPKKIREEKMKEVGRRFGSPDFKKRTFFRAVMDGRYKLVRWFSPREYGNPTTLHHLYAASDPALYDLETDPGELENLAHPQHPRHDPLLVEKMLQKLNALIQEEMGEDSVPFDLNIFGTREIIREDAWTNPSP